MTFFIHGTSRRDALAGVLAAAAAAAIPAASAAQPAARGGGSSPMVDFRDIHSYARPAEARVTHVSLDLAADFAAKRISGTATLDLQVAPGARELVLDTAGGLEPLAVTDTAGRALPFALGAADALLGRPLTIQLRPGVRRVAVRYRTSPEAGALQWLEPSQTAGGRHPYLFSQGQAILTRTWVPTQDSPGVRQTWDARIVAPTPLRVVMSADRVGPADGVSAPGGRAFRYRMTHPVPPYLIAIGVGDIAFRAVDRRTGVYAEPSVIEAAASEFADVGRMVDVAERLYGPYRWGRYDLLVLPPSFPFGGMENPTLTFATPTVIAGDRSLVSLVAHELAHSWSGNLVTNAVWADFWLNEGFTVYFESRIMEALYGPERAAMLRVLGWQDLQRQIEELGGRTAPDTRLHLDLTGRDPDDAMTDIAYEKGAAFLRSIEAAVGRPRFDRWLGGYFDRHAFQPITAALFLQDIRANLIRGDAALERRLQLQEWIYQPGLPSSATAPTSALIEQADAQARAFAGGAAASAIRTDGWVTQQWQRFLRGLPRSLPAARLAELDRTFNLSPQGNGEILFDWLELAIANRFGPAVPALEAFLARQGRRKFVAPLFTALLAQGDWGRPIARRIYARTRAGYHPVTYRTVDQAFEAAGVPRA